jgi:hypothetical protein
LDVWDAICPEWQHHGWCLHSKIILQYLSFQNQETGEFSGPEIDLASDPELKRIGTRAAGELQKIIAGLKSEK